MNRQYWAVFGISLLIIAVLIVALTAVRLTNHQAAGNSAGYNTARLRLAGQTLFVRIPLTNSKSTLGLGGVTALPADQGMLWRYSDPQVVTFWMKGMKIPLDFIWIKDGQVIGITANVSPPTSTTVELPLYQPPAAIDRVLEVNAGYAQRHHVDIGTEVTEENL